MILEQYSISLKGVPLRDKKCIHAIDMFDNYSIMSCSTAITSVVNTLKKNYLSGTILDKFSSTYYDDNNDNFGLLFQQYTAIAVGNIYHPSILKVWKANMDN